MASKSAVAPLFPVFITGDVPPKFIAEFLSAAYAGPTGKLKTPFALRVIDSVEDVKKELQPSKTPFESLNAKQQPLWRKLEDRQLWNITLQNDGLRKDLMIYLDDPTGHEYKGSCRLVKLIRPSTFKHVRVDFLSALAVATAVEQKRLPIKQVANQAALDGGVLKQFGMHGANSLGTTLSYLTRSGDDGLRSLNQGFHGVPLNPRSIPTNIAVFATADFRAKPIHWFVEMTYKQPWIAHTGFFFTLITSDSMPLIARNPTKSTAELMYPPFSGNPFRGKDIFTINDFVKKNFYGWPIDQKFFIVFDQHTTRGRGCLLADSSNQTNPGLALVRVSMESAMLAYSAVCATEESVESLQIRAAKLDGIYHVDMGPEQAEAIRQENLDLWVYDSEEELVMDEDEEDEGDEGDEEDDEDDEDYDYDDDDDDYDNDDINDDDDEDNPPDYETSVRGTGTVSFSLRP